VLRIRIRMIFTITSMPNSPTDIHTHIADVKRTITTTTGILASIYKSNIRRLQKRGIIALAASGAMMTWRSSSFLI